MDFLNLLKKNYINDKFIERLQVVGIDNNFPKDYNDTYKTSRV